jgi:hypothetical protein
MSYLLAFSSGMLASFWFTSFCLNRYYRSAIWEMQEKLQVEQLKARLKQEEARRTRYEKEIDDLLRQRTAE